MNENRNRNIARWLDPVLPRPRVSDGLTHPVTVRYAAPKARVVR